MNFKSKLKFLMQKNPQNYNTRNKTKGSIVSRKLDCLGLCRPRLGPTWYCAIINMGHRDPTLFHAFTNQAFCIWISGRHRLQRSEIAT